MPLLTFLVVVCVLLLVLYLVHRYLVPMLPHPIGMLVLAITVILIIAWLLGAVGLIPALGGLRVGG
jgi:hypothetical protein